MHRDKTFNGIVSDRGFVRAWSIISPDTVADLLIDLGILVDDEIDGILSKLILVGWRDPEPCLLKVSTGKHSFSNTPLNLRRVNLLATPFLTALRRVNLPAISFLTALRRVNLPPSISNNSTIEFGRSSQEPLPRSNRNQVAEGKWTVAEGGWTVAEGKWTVAERAIELVVEET